MRLGIIHRYIFMEMLPTFLVSLLIFTFIFLITNLLQLMELIINKGVDILDVIKIFLFFSPTFLVFTLPMSLLLAVLLSFMKLSAMNEITAMKSSGISLYQLLPPVIFFSTIIYLLTSFTAIYLHPRAEHAQRDLLLRLSRSKAHIALKQQVFNDEFPGMVIYASKVSTDGTRLQDVFIYDERDEEITSNIIAQRGEILSEEKTGHIMIRLFDGEIHRLSRDYNVVETIKFDTYDLALDTTGMAGRSRRKKSLLEMGLRELKQLADSLPDGSRKKNLVLLEYHKKFSLPFACLVLGLIGVPLGIQSYRATRSWSVILGVAIFLIYYIFLTIAWSLGKSGLFSPVILMWLPNFIVGVSAIILTHLAAQERGINIFSLIKKATAFISTKSRNSSVNVS